MKTRVSICSASGFLILCALVSVIAIAQNGASPTDPIPVGTTVKTEIQCGSAAGSMESYDASISVLKVLRGADAWNLLKEANPSNKQPQAGYEYMLVRISFSMKARGAPADKTFDLGRPMQFLAIAADGREYLAPSLTLPKPQLARTVGANQLAEGWVAFMVEQKETNPLMIFDPSSGGAMGRGRTVFFKL
jgi:hypothetical protein